MVIFPPSRSQLVLEQTLMPRINSTGHRYTLRRGQDRQWVLSLIASSIIHHPHADSNMCIKDLIPYMSIVCNSLPGEKACMLFERCNWTRHVSIAACEHCSCKRKDCIGTCLLPCVDMGVLRRANSVTMACAGLWPQPCMEPRQLAHLHVLALLYDHMCRTS